MNWITCVQTSRTCRPCSRSAASLERPHTRDNSAPCSSSHVSLREDWRKKDLGFRKRRPRQDRQRLLLGGWRVDRREGRRQQQALSEGAKRRPCVQRRPRQGYPLQRLGTLGQAARRRVRTTKAEESSGAPKTRTTITFAGLTRSRTTSEFTRSRTASERSSKTPRPLATPNGTSSKSR